MSKKLLILILPVMLAACAVEPPQPLAQKLAGKSPEEKQEILRLACLNEAEYSTIQFKKKLRPANIRHRDISDTPETTHLKSICREMTDNYSMED